MEDIGDLDELVDSNTDEYRAPFIPDLWDSKTDSTISLAIFQFFTLVALMVLSVILAFVQSWEDVKPKVCVVSAWFRIVLIVINLLIFTGSLDEDYELRDQRNVNFCLLGMSALILIFDTMGLVGACKGQFYGRQYFTKDEEVYWYRIDTSKFFKDMTGACFAVDCAFLLTTMLRIRQMYKLANKERPKIDNTITLKDYEVPLPKLERALVKWSSHGKF